MGQDHPDCPVIINQAVSVSALSDHLMGPLRHLKQSVTNPAVSVSALSDHLMGRAIS